MVRKSKSPKPSPSPGQFPETKKNQSFQKSPGSGPATQSPQIGKFSINGKMKSSKDKTPTHTPQKGNQTPIKTPQKGNQTPGKTPQKGNKGQIAESQEKKSGALATAPKPNLKRKAPAAADDEDPDDIGEEELMRLLNESDDEDDDFDFDEDEESEEEDEESSSPEDSSPSKKLPASKAVVKEIVDDDESDDESDEQSGFLQTKATGDKKDNKPDEEIEKLLRKMKDVAQTKTDVGPEVDSDDEDDDDDDDEEADEAEIEALLQKMKESPKKKAVGSKEEEEEEESDEDDEEDEDDSADDAEIEALLQKMKESSKKQTGSSKVEKEESDEEEDEDDDDEDDSADDAEIEALLQKMKKSPKKQAAGSKKEEEEESDDESPDDAEIEAMLKLMRKEAEKDENLEPEKPKKKRNAPDDDDEEETEGPLKRQRAELQDSDSEDEMDDDDDEEDDSEIEALLKNIKEQKNKMPDAKPSKKRTTLDDDDEPMVAKKLKTHPESNDTAEEAKTDQTSNKKPLEKRYLQPTPDVVDPKLRKEIETQIINRLQSTIRIRPIPPVIRSEDIEKLCPDAVAIRIPWNKMTKRSKKVAFLEFADKSTADKWAEKLKGSVYEKKKLMVDRETELNEQGIKAYNCRRIAVANLPWNIEKTHLWKHFSRADYMDILSAGAQDKRAPSMAFITFKTDRDALEAFEKAQGTRIKGKRVSVCYQKKPYDFDHRDHMTLVIFGIRKNVSEADLAAAFTRAKDVSIKTKGMAIATYDDHNACMTDYKERQRLWIGGRPLVVSFGSRKGADTKRVGEGVKVEEVTKPKVERKVEIDRKAIFVKSLEHRTKVSDLRAIFLDASEVDLPIKGNHCKGYAVIKFLTEEAAAAALAKASSATLHGRKIQAMYSKPGSLFNKKDPEATTGKAKPEPQSKEGKNKKKKQAKVSPSGDKKPQNETKPNQVDGKKKNKNNKKGGQPGNKQPFSKEGKKSPSLEGPKVSLPESKKGKPFEGNKKFQKAKVGGAEAMDVDDTAFTPKKQQAFKKFGGSVPGKRKSSDATSASPPKKQKFDNAKKHQKQQNKKNFKAKF